MPPRRNSVTVIDIARAAGVSKSTVSLVLQGSPLVKPATAKKVQETIDRLGYVYNRGAANLRSAQSNVVGMVINDLTNPFFVEMTVGIERVFRAAGFVPFIANTAESTIRQTDVLKAMREQGVAGLIVSPARGTAPDAFQGFLKAGIPVVLAMRSIEGSRTGSVTPDNEQGAVIATKHLINLGYRRIAFLGGYPDIDVRQDRVRGFKRALKNHSYDIDEALIVEFPPNREDGINALTRLMASKNPPDAAICFNDSVAFGAMLALNALDLSAGKDFGIVGFDDVVDARHWIPPLTTVAVDSFGLGERAAHAVLKMIESGRVTAEDFTGSVQLVVRESCGAPFRSDKGLVA